MFCTLKQNGRAGQSYTFETTTPPFSKKREGRLAKIACTKCRISKLKCSGEPHGCQRCLAKKIDCRYPDPSRGGHSHKKARTQAPTPPETPQTQSPSRPPSVHVDATVDDDFLTVTSGHEMGYTLDDLDLSLNGFEMSHFTTLENVHGLLSDCEYMDPSDAMTQWNQSIIYTSDNVNSPWNSTPEREDILFNTDNKTSPAAYPQDKSEPDSSCACFARAAATYEAIEIAIWAQSESQTNTDDVLQSQKKALSDCEGLLECARCSAQSAYIMLLLSTCRRILTTLEQLCRGGAGKTPPRDPDARKRRRHGDDSSDADEESRTRGYGISIRNRQLDDDDEHLVLQSLVAARVARLGRLLSSLDSIVSGHRWSAHKGVVQELQRRLVGNSFDARNIRAR